MDHRQNRLDKRNIPGIVEFPGIKKAGMSTTPKLFDGRIIR
jgi:hypothetical protein